MTKVDHEHEAEKAEYRRDTREVRPPMDASREMKALVIGVDPAGKAGDNTAVVLRIGSERHILRQPLASAFIELAKEHKPELLAFASKIARMTQDGEELDGREFVMENDDAVATLNDLISQARDLIESQAKAGA
jgi:hypothetical protein